MNEQTYTLALGEQLGKSLENLQVLIGVIENLANRVQALEESQDAVIRLLAEHGGAIGRMDTAERS